MPPKAKFTAEEIINAAFEIARAEGLEKITARELGNRLGSSARPIFTVFESMDMIRTEVILRAKKLYGQYVAAGLQEPIAFKGVGTAYIRFSMQEPKLFQILFMSADPKQTSVEHILPRIDADYERILESVQIPYELDRQAADRIYQHLWTYTHGIATMCATGLCDYTAQQISDRLTEIFKSLLMMEKGGYARNDQNR